MKSINNIRNNRLTIVTYHRVTDRKVEQIDGSLRSLFVNVETFEKQLSFFRKHYKVTTLQSLGEYIDNGNIPPNLMLVAFDDGYQDFIQHAYPTLRRHGVPAALFLVPGKIGNAGGFSFWWDEMFHHMELLRRRDQCGSPNHIPRNIRKLLAQFTVDASLMFHRITDTCSDSAIKDILETIRVCLGDDANINCECNPMLTWQQISELSDLVELGSHTMHHRNMKFLSGKEMSEEVHQSKREIEAKTGKRVVAFSYPNGYYNKEIEEQVKAAGYRFAFTTDKGVEDLRDLYHMKRINIWERSSSVLTKPFSEGKLAMKLIGL